MSIPKGITIHPNKGIHIPLKKPGILIPILAILPLLIRIIFLNPIDSSLSLSISLNEIDSSLSRSLSLNQIDDRLSLFDSQIDDRLSSPSGNRSSIEHKMTEEGRAHPHCRNASNPYHECSDYCFKIIAEAKARIDAKEQEESRAIASNTQPRPVTVPDQAEDLHDEIDDLEDHPNGDSDNVVEENVEVDMTKLSGRQKKLFELRLKMNAARKANQAAMVAEKKRMEGPTESRGVSKEKWIEERKKKIGKLLDANGLDMTKAFMLDTEEMAEAKYKKWEKEPAPFGWDVFNQKTLYNAYKKRTKNVEIDMEEYNRMKETDPEFYREASSLQYGKAPKTSEDRIEKMVKELKDRDEKRKSFSRRRRFRDEKDIDSINDRNEHFNKKIERAFGKYTLEIKNNLERGTALPD